MKKIKKDWLVELPATLKEARDVLHRAASGDKTVGAGAVQAAKLLVLKDKVARAPKIKINKMNETEKKLKARVRRLSWKLQWAYKLVDKARAVTTLRRMKGQVTVRGIGLTRAQRIYSSVLKKLNKSIEQLNKFYAEKAQEVGAKSAWTAVDIIGKKHLTIMDAAAKLFDQIKKAKKAEKIWLKEYKEIFRDVKYFRKKIKNWAKYIKYKTAHFKKEFGNSLARKMKRDFVAQYKETLAYLKETYQASLRKLEELGERPSLMSF